VLKDGTTLSLAAMTWGEVFPVAELWTQIFCEYYYGVDNKEKTYERRVSEFLYYFTMLYSSIACALDNQAFCAIAFCARDEGKEASGAIAGRYVGPQLGSYHKVLFGDYWDTLAAQQFQADGEDLKLLYLWNFGVQRESRKRGVGEKIMKRVESVEATGVDIKGIFLFVYKTNHAAIRLYEKLGYSVVESWKDPRWMKQAENNLTGVERKLLMIKVV